MRRRIRSQQIRRRLLTELARSGATPNPQALTALTEMIQRSCAEVVGHTDSLLLGLLCSGFYTLDVLESAGVNPDHLRRIAAQSVNFRIDRDIDADPLDSLFTSDSWNRVVSDELIQQGGMLDTAHLLTAAVIPDQASWEETDYGLFPIELESGPLPATRLEQQLHARVRELLMYLVSYLAVDFQGLTQTQFDRGDTLVAAQIRRRKHGVSPEEDHFLDVKLGRAHPEMYIDEFQFAIQALDQWFVHRRVLTDPGHLCLRTVDRCGTLLLGPQCFIQSGGSLQVVASELQAAEWAAPERDLTGFTLFNRDGRIRVGQYTYRNTFLSDTRVKSGFPILPVSVQGPRPVSLLPPETVRGLEDLLSREQLATEDIRRFLKEHPELFRVLGYTSVSPQIILRPEGEPDTTPEFLLETPSRPGFDILEIGLPSATVVTEHPEARMAADLARAVARLRKYDQFFESAGNRKAFYLRFGFTAFRPELAVIIGRGTAFRSAPERAEIESQLGKIRLITYDDILQYGHSRAQPLPGIDDTGRE